MFWSSTTHCIPKFLYLHIHVKNIVLFSQYENEKILPHLFHIYFCITPLNPKLININKSDSSENLINYISCSSIK